MEKGKRKEMLLAGGVLLFLLLAVLAAVTAMSVGGKRREIEQKVLFIYCFTKGRPGSGYVKKGYFIDGKGNQVEYDFTKKLQNHEGGLDNYGVLEMLEEMEYEKSEEIFSEREVEKLYDWLYKIDAEDVIDMKYDSSIMEPGRSYKLLGIRYKEDGTAEIIEIFDVAFNHIVIQKMSQDPYALKVRERLLEKNPIVYWLEIIIDGEMTSF